MCFILCLFYFYSFGKSFLNQNCKDSKERDMDGLCTEKEKDEDEDKWKNNG